MSVIVTIHHCLRDQDPKGVVEQRIQRIFKMSVPGGSLSKARRRKETEFLEPGLGLRERE